MTVLICLLVLIAAMLVWTGWQLARLRRDIRTNTDELKKLRLDSRARVSTVALRTGANPEEKKLRQLRRLGRQTQAKRVVVGGDPASDQHQALSRQVDTGDHNDD